MFYIIAKEFFIAAIKGISTINFSLYYKKIEQLQRHLINSSSKCERKKIYILLQFKNYARLFETILK